MPEPIVNASAPRGFSWGIVLGFWIAFMFVAGGTSLPSPSAKTAQSIVSAFLLGASLWRLRQGFPNRFATMGWALLALGFLLVVIQLIPLPPSVWQVLPGRELIKDTLTLTGPTLPWLPISLVPNNTTQTLLTFVPVFAGFLAALSLKNRDALHLAAILVLCALIAVIVGLLQKTGRAPDFLYLYGKSVPLAATGAFGNRNFLAAQIFASVPFLAIIATATQRSQRMRPFLVLLFVLIYMAIMLAGLAIVGSRGGILMAMPAVLLTLLFVYRPLQGTSQVKKSGLATVAVIVGLIAMSQASMLGILRLVETDPIADYRSTIFAVSMSSAKAFWPVGSGFGSFVDVYQMFETPSAMIDRYVNAAHNDWLQLLIEGGAGAAALLAGFVLMFCFGLVRIVGKNMAADEFSAAVRAGALTVGLLGVHAAFDFGLRTPALLSLFSVACGLVCLSGRSERGQWQPARRENSSAPTDTQPQFPARARKPGQTYFKVNPPA